MSFELQDLVSHKEKRYFTLVLIFAVIGWLAITISIVGIIYALIFALTIWFINGLLIAHLKSETVQASENQFPELYQVFNEVCDRLQLKSRPEIFVMQSEGFLNAFATRWSGRDFVVIYSAILEAYGHNSSQIRFLVGHEIGHVKQRHILKRILLLPGLIIPLLGKAYSRACETTCDRYGSFAAREMEGAIRAMMTLSCGKEASPISNPEAFANQYHNDRGFFVSWHELNSGYPTLAQRVSQLLDIKSQRPTQSKKRNSFAYLFAFFTSSKAMIIIIIMAIYLAALIPAIKAGAEKKRQTNQQTYPQEETTH